MRTTSRSSTTTERRQNHDHAEEWDAPRTPGEILKEEFMKPLGLSANALARALGVPTNRVTGILKRHARYHRRHGTSARPGVWDEP